MTTIRQAELPPPYLQFFKEDGTPAAGYLVFVYQAGTTTKKVSYTDSTGLTPNTNPVVCDAQGRCSIWVPPLDDGAAGVAGASGAMVSQTIDLTPTQMMNWDITPVTLIPAPGINQVLMPMFQMPFYTYGSYGWTDNPDTASIDGFYGADGVTIGGMFTAANLLAGVLDKEINSVFSGFNIGSFVTNTFLTKGQPLVSQASAQILPVETPVGPLSAFTIFTPGQDYAIGDVGLLIQGGSSNDATWRVTAVNILGGVTGLTITGFGSDDYVNNVATSLFPVTGSGLNGVIKLTGAWPISRVSILNGGSGFALNDTGVYTQSGSSSDVHYKVTGVLAGVITELEITGAFFGTDYHTGTATLTPGAPQAGAGTGASVQIVVLTDLNNSTVRIVTWYSIADAPIASGSIATFDIADGGSGYVVNDTVIPDGGNPQGLLTVNSVDGGGAVLTATATLRGLAYAVGTNIACPGGTGTGLLIDITAIN